MVDRGRLESNDEGTMQCLLGKQTSQIRFYKTTCCTVLYFCRSLLDSIHHFSGASRYPHVFSRSFFGTVCETRCGEGLGQNGPFNEGENKNILFGLIFRSSGLSQ